MALPSTNGRLAVRALTRHQRTTQVLGSVGGIGWYMGVCPPSPVAVSDDEAQTVPDMERLRVFYVPGDCAIKLHEGTVYGIVV